MDKPEMTRMSTGHRFRDDPRSANVWTVHIPGRLMIDGGDAKGI
jgi:hypothetical protein